MEFNEEGDTVNKLMPSIQDREIFKQEQDSFGHIHFTQALKSLIESPNNQPPFTIGVLGKWGVGKSSIKETYKFYLNDDKSKDEKGKLRAQKIQLVTFNAWRFGEDNLRRSLLRHVYLELGGDQETLKDKLFKQISRYKAEKKSFREIVKEYCNLWAGFLIHFLLLFLILCLASTFTIHYADITNDWAKSTIIGAALVAGFFFMKYLTSNPEKFIPSFISNSTHIEFPATSIEEYEDMLIAQLKVFHNANQLCERLVIFVDDLDRLPSHEMIKGIDAIRSFMEIPQSKLPEGLGIVFVVSCDEEKISQALLLRNTKETSVNVYSEWNSNTEARRYLDRIFQFRLEIPPFPKRDMREFATHRLRNDLHEIYEELLKRNVSIEELIDRMIHPGVQSPRNAIHILNEFAQSWWIACKREKNGSGTHKPGGLREGAVTNHAITLGIICVLKVDFPKFFCDLQKHPNLINQFTDVFARNINFNIQPQQIQTVLKTYCDQGNDLHKKYYPLSTYLSGLAGHQWPPSLLPFLLLTQDSISRNENNDGLYEYLVQADDQAILRALGRHIDAKLLSEDQMRLLHDILEDIQQDTVTKKNLAALALARLVERYPSNQAHLIVGSLTRQIIDDQKLRWMIGVEKIEKIMDKANPEQKQDIVSVLIKDLLKVEGNIDFKLESMQTPSFIEAVEMVKFVCGMALKTRKQYGLDIDSDRRLLDWLLERHVGVSGHSETLPFSDLEYWLVDNEDHLLKDIGAHYTDIISDKLKSDDCGDINMEIVVPRCRSVFNSLASKGEEDRPHLWKLLNQFVAVKNKDAVKLSWETMLEYQAICPEEALTEFIKNMSGRLLNEMTEDEKWSIQWEEGARAIITLVSNNINRINIVSPMDQLIINWSVFEQCDDFAFAMIELLFMKKSPIIEVVLKGWANNILLELQDRCMSWLSKHFSLYSEDVQNEIVTHLNLITAPENVTDDNSKRYSSFIKALPSNVFQLPTLAQHINTMYSIVQKNCNNLAYLKQVFDTMIYTVEISPKNEAGAMLTGTLSKNTGNLESFSWLHSRIQEKWPSPEKTNYDGEGLFSMAYSFVVNNPSYENTNLVLDSIVSMVTDGIVQPDNRIVAAAVMVWPYHKKAACDAFITQKLLPSLDDIVKLINSIDYNITDDVQLLFKTWAYFGTLIDIGQSSAVLRSILNRPVVNANVADMELNLWVRANSNQKINLLLDGIIIEDLNDEQRKRIWLQIEQNLSDLDKQMLLELLKKLFEMMDIPSTVQAVFDSQIAISNRLEADHNDLGLSLLGIAHFCKSQEYKNRLLEWAKAIQTEKVLKQYLDTGEADEEEQELLKDYFPDAPIWRKGSRLNLG